MNVNYNNRNTNPALISGFFTKTSMLTVTIASAVCFLMLIFDTFVSAASGTKISMLSSLYYLFGDGSVSVVNAVFGGTICVISALFFISFISIYLQAKGKENVASGFNLLTVSSVIYIITVCIVLIFSFASITVQRYESSIYDFDSLNEAYEAYTSLQASWDFFIYTLFGAAALVKGIGAVRLALAVKKAALREEIPSKRGFALFITGGISSAVLTSIYFFADLSSFVVVDVLDLTPATLLNSIINIFVFAAVSALFYGLLFLASGYADMISRTYQPTPRVNSYYAAYATNVNRPPVSLPNANQAPVNVDRQPAQLHQAPTEASAENKNTPQ